jgi:hypothetical protein
MTELLTELLSTNLIEKIDGEDSLLHKIESAAGAVAEALRTEPPTLIRAVLAGLDPDIPLEDPAIDQSVRALRAAWPSFEGRFPGGSIELHRAILLEACHQAAEGGIPASVLWLTAADTLPLLRLGRQEPAIRRMLMAWAERAERHALEGMAASTPELAPPDMPEPVKLDFKQIPAVDRDQLRLNFAGSVFQNYKGDPVPNPNNLLAIQPHQVWNPQNWAGEFADRMTDLFGGELDGLSTEVDNLAIETNKQLEALQVGFGKVAFEALNAHREAARTAIQAEQLRLNALWWSQALYSPSLRRSYRELPVPLTAAVMAFDLLGGVQPPTPASVGYLLAETVDRLPEASYDRKHPLRELLGGLREARGEFPATEIAPAPPPETGRLSLRDLAVLALMEKTFDLDAALARAGGCGDFEMSLPGFAHALFRQEQAIRLAARSGAGP